MTLFSEKYLNIWLSSPWLTRITLLVSGALFPLAFAPFNFWPLAYVSLISLLFVGMKNEILSDFKIGYYWGLGCFGVGGSWVYVSIHEFGNAPWYGAILLTLVFIAYLALFKGLFSWACLSLYRRSYPLLIILIAPMIWVVSELLQSHLLSGFPLLIAGYSQIDSPLQPIASLLGVYGVSWFVVIIATTFTLMIVLKDKRTPVHITIILFLMVASSYFSNASFYDRSASSTSSQPFLLDVGLVQPNIAQEKKWDRRFFKDIIDSTIRETEGLWGADLIVWPEGSIPAYSHQVSNITEALNSSGLNANSQLLLGILDYEPDKSASFVALKSYGKHKHSYHKQILVPFGEYVPFEQWLRGLIEFFDLPMSGFSLPVQKQKPMLFDNYAVIPAICYEIVFPDIVRELSKQAEKSGLPQLIVTVSNDAWFGDSFGPYQHMQMARMRALELGLPLVRSTNDGITAMVDAQGQVIKQLPRYIQSSLRAKISLANRETIYRQWGMLGVALILLISGLIIAYFFRKNGLGLKSSYN